ncbi:MAG TPA: PAS domain S-box protein, partial [Gammaproteobacteria bacterium]|nr:PAS domain S-box protein [Gammaproteobacteria bacterium]
IAALTTDGAVVEVNPAALEFLDAPRREVIGRPLWEFITDTATAERLRAAVGRAASGESVQQRLHMQAAGGRSGLTRLTFSLIRDARGEKDLVLAEGRDEPAAHHASNSAASRDKYAGIVNISADAIICVDADGRITDFNWGAERIFGYSEAEVVRQPLEMLMPERYRSKHGEYLRSFADSTVASRRMGERREIVGLRRNGEEFPADASISRLEIDGRLVYTAVLRDATVQKRAEAAQRFLARAGSLLASSLDVATTFDSVARLATDFIADCCVIFDEDESGQIRRVALAASDPAVERILQEYRGRLLSRSSSHPACRVIESGQPMLLADFAAEFAPDSGSDLELLRRLNLRTAMLVPLVARGRTSGAIGLYGCTPGRRFDVDDLALAQELALGSALAVDNARLYEAARRAILAREDVLAVVSHDLGNPLSAIRIAVSLLLRNAGPEAAPDGGHDHLIGIKRSVEQMERLIRDLLDVKRIEAGQLSLEPRRVEPESLITRTTELFRMIAEGKSISILPHAAPALPSIRADRG